VFLAGGHECQADFVAEIAFGGRRIAAETFERKD
jgi:hypothetical protein